MTHQRGRAASGRPVLPGTEKSSPKLLRRDHSDASEMSLPCFKSVAGAFQQFPMGGVGVIAGSSAPSPSPRPSLTLAFGHTSRLHSRCLSWAGNRSSVPTRGAPSCLTILQMLVNPFFGVSCSILTSSCPVPACPWRNQPSSFARWSPMPSPLGIEAPRVPSTATAFSVPDTRGLVCE